MKTDKKLEQEKQLALEFMIKTGMTNRLPEAMANIEKRHARRQRRNHIIFWIIVFTVVTAIMCSVTAQNKISDTMGLRGSYDSVAGALIGVTFHFNN
jgi:Ni/Fe-hydrogenase subunit HybB-like protein